MSAEMVVDRMSDDVLSEIERVLREAEAELAAASTPDELEQWRIKYLGTKGQVKGLMTLLSQVPREQKPAVGQRVNSVKERLTTGLETRKESLGGAQPADKDAEDVTEPGRTPQLGNRHILMKVVDELTELFGRMGFAVAGRSAIQVQFKKKKTAKKKPHPTPPAPPLK
jgi:phenylalanyl-tRNA synthetase alpha chain